MEPLPNTVEELLGYFEYSHLPPGLQKTSKLFHDLAHEMVPDTMGLLSNQTVTGLQKLLEAKDCFVRAALFEKEHHEIW